MLPLLTSKLSNWIDVVASVCFTSTFSLLILAQVQWGVAVDRVRLSKLLDVEFKKAEVQHHPGSHWDLGRQVGVADAALMTIGEIVQ